MYVVYALMSCTSVYMYTCIYIMYKTCKTDHCTSVYVYICIYILCTKHICTTDH